MPRTRGDAKREKVEVQRAVGGRRERHELAAMLRLGRCVNRLQRRGLAAEAGPVEDDLEDELSRERVERRHRGGQHTPRSPRVRTAGTNRGDALVC